MAKYRKKPVEVEAEQFLPGKPLPFSGRGPIVCLDDNWYVNTVHGQRAILEEGDWVILEPRGVNAAYPCKPDIFAASYDSEFTVAVYVVEFYSHENEYHWEETGTFKTESEARQHFEMKAKTFPRSRWRLHKVEELATRP